MADSRGRSEASFRGEEASDLAGASFGAQPEDGFDEERSGRAGGDCLGGRDSFAEGHSFPHDGSGRSFEAEREARHEERVAPVAYRAELQGGAFEGRFQENGAARDAQARGGEGEGTQPSFRDGAQSTSPMESPRFGGSPGFQGVPPSAPVAYPQRHKVPLPKPSLRAELRENLEQVKALLRIPQEPFKDFKGKKFSSQLYLGLSYAFPIIHWVRNYKKKDLVGDVVAGLAVWSLIPEDLGYALLANLPPSYGLLSSFLPPVAYAILGTSRHLAVGPTPLISLLIGSLCSRFYSPGAQGPQYVALVTASTMISGLFCAALGLLRLGFVADLLSHAAILGFLAGASVLSILIEFVNIVGYTSRPSDYGVVYLLGFLFTNTSEFNWRPFLLGTLMFCFLQTLKYLARRYTEGTRGRVLFYLKALGPFIVVFLSTLCVFLTKASNPPKGMPTVAEISAGSGFSSVGNLQKTLSGPDLGPAIGIGVIVGLMSLSEAFAISRTFAAAQGYSILQNKEMIALGTMNVVSSLSSGFAIAGSFPRSALSFSAGANTQLFALVQSLGVLIMVFALFPVFSFLPLAALSAVIIDAVLQLIRIPGIVHLWRTDKMDFLVFLATFLCILFLTIEIGFLVAVGAALFKVMVPIARPSVVALGEVPGTGLFRPLQQYSTAEETPGVLVISVDGPIVFSSAGYVRETIQEVVKEREEAGMPVKMLVLELTPVSDVDTTGIHALFEMLRFMKSAQMAICNPTRMVLRKLVASGFLDALGPEKLFFSAHEAVQEFRFLQQQLRRGIGVDHESDEHDE